jgi:hypothetical protein
MWSSWVKENGTTQVMYITKLKDGPKRVKKTFSMILERVFEMVWWRGEKMNHIKKDLQSWSVFLPSEYWLPLYLKRLLELSFFFFLFFNTFLSFFLLYSISWGLRVLMIFEEKNHFFKNFLFKWLDMVMTLDILAVDAYSGMELCTAI